MQPHQQGCKFLLPGPVEIKVSSSLDPRSKTFKINLLTVDYSAANLGALPGRPETASCSGPRKAGSDQFVGCQTASRRRSSARALTPLILGIITDRFSKRVQDGPALSQSIQALQNLKPEDLNRAHASSSGDIDEPVHPCR
jgi:hypothetical protein